jgi:hypothetical protein
LSCFLGGLRPVHNHLPGTPAARFLKLIHNNHSTPLQPGSGVLLVVAHFAFIFSPSSTKPTSLIEHSMTFVGEHGHFVAHFDEARFNQGP